MDRRKFFRSFPAAIVALPVVGWPTPKADAEPSVWSEMVCQNEGYGSNRPGCGTRIKFLRVAHTPICPKCGWVQDMSRTAELRAKISGIEVK